MGTFYTAGVAARTLELEDNEIRMLLVAIRQVQHTFAIAEAQSVAAGEPLATDYQGVRDAYERLQRKLSALTGPDKPHVVK